MKTSTSLWRSCGSAGSPPKVKPSLQQQGHTQHTQGRKAHWGKSREKDCFIFQPLTLRPLLSTTVALLLTTEIVQILLYQYNKPSCRVSPWGRPSSTLSDFSKVSENWRRDWAMTSTPACVYPERRWDLKVWGNKTLINVYRLILVKEPICNSEQFLNRDLLLLF